MHATATNATAAKAALGAPHGSRRSHAAALRAATIGDQIIVSLTNFGLTLAIGRAFSSEEFASYGIGLSIGLMMQGIQRHAISIPLMLRPSELVFRRQKAILGEQFLILLITLIVGTAALCAAYAWNATRYGHLVVAASVVCLVVYLELEFSRAFLVKLGRAWLLIAGATWYGLTATALALASLLQGIDYETMLAGLGVAMLLHGLTLPLVAGFPSMTKGFRHLRSDLQRFGGWAAAATATYAGYNHIPLLVLGAIAAPAHAAAFVAARSLLQPLQIVLRGLDVADKSSFSDAARKPHHPSTLGFTVSLAIRYAMLAGAFCLLMALFAETIVAIAYGAKFSGLSPALLAWIPAYVLLSVTMPLESLIYARGAFRGYYAIRGIASLAAIAASIPLILRYFEVGAIMACTLGWLIGTIGTFALLRRGTRS